MFSFFKRMFLLAVINLLIILTLQVVFQVIMGALGIEIGAFSQLIVYYAIIGMGGAFFSLAISRQMAKWMMGVQVIDVNTQNPGERRLVEIVHGLAQRARLPALPEVGIYDSPEINAFATGPTKSRALVAVSTGLLRQMDNEAVEGVLGHEVTHIANGDMVTMTLIQGLMNTMVLIMARLLANVIASQFEERSRPAIGFGVYMLLQIVLSLLGSMVVCYFSRAREYRADAGGARLAGRDRMIRGLKSLRAVYGQVDTDHPSLATLKISGRPTGILALLSTHPPLEDRIRRLESAAIS